MNKLFLSTLLLCLSSNLYAKDLSYYLEKDLSISLTDVKCSKAGHQVKAKLPKYAAFNGCYLVKNGYVMILWENNTTSLFKTTEFTLYQEI